MGTWDIILIMVLNKANLDCLTIYLCQLLCSYDLKFDKAVILWGEILLYSVLQKRLLIAFLSCLAWVKEGVFISRLSMKVVLRTVVVDSDCRFDNLCGNNLHSQDSEDDYRTGCRILNLLMKFSSGFKAFTEGVLKGCCNFWNCVDGILFYTKICNFPFAISALSPCSKETAMVPETPGDSPYNGPYREAPSERGTFFRLQIYEIEGIS